MMPIEKTFNLNHVAIRLIKRIDNWAIVELGRLSEHDTELLEEAFKNRKPDLTDEMADPMQGEIAIEAPIAEGCPPYKTARACFYLNEAAKRKLRDPKEIRNACRVSIWYTAACTRPTISDVSGEPIRDGGNPECWFYKHPTQWDKDYHSRRGEVKLEADCARPFAAVALKIVKYLGGDWYTVKIGRLSKAEKARLEYLYTKLARGSAFPFGDDTRGEVTVTEREVNDDTLSDTTFYEAYLCVRIYHDAGVFDGGAREGIMFDACDFDLAVGRDVSEPRLVLKNFRNTPSDHIIAKGWFKEEKEDDDEETEEYLEDEDDDEEENGMIEHEFRNVAVKVLSKSQVYRYYILELGRLTGMEVEWLEKMAGRNDHAADSIVGKWDVTNGTVISTYIDGLGFRAARVCVCGLCSKMPGVGTVMDSANITIRASEDNVRMSLMNIVPNDSSYNTSSANWFSKVGKWGEEETTMPEEAFALMGVAIKTRGAYQTYSGIYDCRIHVGRMSESERHNLESFVAGISACHGPYRIPIRMVEGGKTIPGTCEPLHTYELHVYMATPPSPVVDVCDLKFTYVAEKGMILAEVINVRASFGIRGVNWFNAQMEEQSDAEGYVDTDILLTENLDTVCIRPIRTGTGLYETIPEIDKIEFHEPATIIFWKDGTKSVVQARDGEPYDAEKGIAMAIAKKALGNERDYYNTFIHWIKRYKKKGGKR